LPSLALGTTEVTPLNLTAAYAVLANQGLTAWPYVIAEIRNRSGEVLYARATAAPRRVVAPDVAANLALMLEQTIESGTGRAANIAWPAAGKTGTSQDYRDAWFVGFTRQYVTGVWIGNDNGAAMDRVTGGGLPAHIWADYMSDAQTGLPALALIDPATPSTTYAQETTGNDNDSFGGLIENLLSELGGSGAVNPDHQQGRDR